MPTYDPQASARGRMLSHMLALQNRANLAADKNWFSAGFAWTRAIMVESVEMMEHYNNWKWWKKRNSPALYQAQLEQVDSWHFALSWFMQRFDCIDPNDWVLNQAIMRRIERAEAAAAATPELDNEAFHAAIDRQVAAAAQGLVDTDAFFLINRHLGLSFEAMYSMYVGKNVLNVFRQQAGYKSGRYAKTWCGREDNEVLEQLQRELVAQGLAGEDFSEALAQRMREAYEQACRQEGLRLLVTDDVPAIVRPLEPVEGVGQAVMTLEGDVKALTLAQFEALPQLPLWETK
ncbi:dUTPase [compost metagenome]